MLSNRLDLNEFVGIPWLDRGRTADGCDCWGLAVLVYRNRFNIELPSYSDQYDTIADRKHVVNLIVHEKDSFIGNDWIEIPKGLEHAGDGILMRLGATPIHVGIVQRPGFMLHVNYDMPSSAIESYKASKYTQRVVGFYRHKQVVA